MASQPAPRASLAVPGIEKPEVAAVFDAYSAELRLALMQLRALVFETAAEVPEAGPVEETLRWGQLSYLTLRSKSGTTIRFDADDSYGGSFALYVNCQTSLVDEWRERYPEMTYGGTRSVHFKLGNELPREQLRHMVAMALTYHSRKKQAS
jgi:hypothetical protein